MQSTTIYLETGQMRELKKRARRKDTTFSSEVREAIDQYLAMPDSRMSEEELEALLNQAQKSMKNMARLLDQANAKIKSVLPLVRKDLERS